MTNKSILFCFILFFSCNEKNTENPRLENSIDPEFEIFIQKFLSEAEKRGLDYSDSINTHFEQFVIQFDDDMNLDEGITGVCWNENGGDITISRNQWENFDSLYKELVIFHELGHCFLNRPHNPEQLEFSRIFECRSLMNPNINGENCVLDYYSTMWRQYYLDELFGILNEPTWKEENVAYGLNSPTNQIYIGENNIAPIEIDTTINFQIEVLFEGRTSFEIKMGDYLLLFDYRGNTLDQGEMVFKLKEKRFLYFDVFKNFSWDEGIPTKLTFRVIDGILYYFFDERIIHSREIVMRSVNKVEILEGQELLDKIIISELL